MAPTWHRTYAALGWAIIALGHIHIAAAPRAFDTLTLAALWFVSGGLTMILTGALNLLNRSYGRTAPGLRHVCLAANLVMTGFATLAGILSHASAVQFVVVVGVFGGASILTLVPSAFRPGQT